MLTGECEAYTSVVRAALKWENYAHTYMLQDSMDADSDDDEYADAVHYEEMTDDDLHISSSCKPLSMIQCIPSYYHVMNICAWRIMLSWHQNMILLFSV